MPKSKKSCDQESTLPYTDFLVNEILPDGQVLHLQDLQPLKQPKGQGQPTGAKSEHQTKATSSHTPALVDGQADNQVDQRTATEAAKPGVSDSDCETLNGLLGEEVATSITQLYNEVVDNPSKKPRSFRTISTNQVVDKETRTQVHQAIRRIFQSRFETTTSDNDTITVNVAVPAVRGRGGVSASGGGQVRGRPGWQDLGGEYLHFTLYKENKDTMEAVYFLASQMKVQTKSFQFSGTKDRRAVTAQRCSAYRIRADQLAGLNKRLRGSRVGDFKYQTTGLELGDLGGNEFVITLRDCHFPGEAGLAHEDRLALARTVVSSSVEDFVNSGFINYYGLQRFGSFTTSTDTIGTKLLQGNLEGAVSDILQFSPAALAAAQDASSTTQISRDDQERAEALHLWLTNQNAQEALQKLPSKFSAEKSLIMHLGRHTHGPNASSHLHDYQGALMSIPRNLRLMYVHAYQSLVWNTVAGKRWKLYGDQITEGDLVLVSEHNGKQASANAVTAEPTTDEQGEPIIRAAPDDRAKQPDDFERARPLTVEEAKSGRYNIFDVVLPLPGFDVVYPPNAVGDEYKSFMASDKGGGLDPYDMRRSWKDLSLSGGYRKVLARPGPGMDWDVRTYTKADEQLVKTDLEVLLGRRMGERDGGPGGSGVVNGNDKMDGEAAQGKVDEHAGPTKEQKIAVILKMKLGSSQYATMALRELMKTGGVKTYKPDFGGGR